MEIQVSEVAVDRAIKKSEKDSKEFWDRFRHASQIRNCLKYGICPQCGCGLVPYVKNKWLSWIQAERRKCSHCGSIYRATPFSYDICDPYWVLENP